MKKKNYQLLLLYIPHGSDNTHFYFLAIPVSILFISHMVQIIQHCPYAFQFALLLFISHMVQIILFTKSVCPFCISLYIPHGSDNTKLPLNTISLLDFHFISHMVQIILPQLSHNTPHYNNFISHMVQIILEYNALICVYFQLYIPHGSDNT